MKADNAIILAAGVSSRFAPLSYERPKALIEVKGEVLIERQIRQLKEAGINEIYVVTGYKAEQFGYLADSIGVKLLHNPDYLVRNNNSSIWAAKDIIANSYICSADNYFAENSFEAEVEEAYYSAVYSEGHTDEWCMKEDEAGYISGVTVGGENSWYMLGHVFWSDDFSKRFLKILTEEYELDETAPKLWEDIFIEHLDELKMKIRKYPDDVIFEFDTLDELRKFDISYVENTRSEILKNTAEKLQVSEADITGIKMIKDVSLIPVGFEFDCSKGHFSYMYSTGELTGDEYM